jgi:hypothetical protein
MNALRLANCIAEIRELLKGQELSFTEIAKIVGELAEYKKTPQYEAYQKYLEDFKAKHAVPTKGQLYHHNSLYSAELTGLEGKRSKLETETSTSTRSSSHDQHERAPNSRFSSAQADVSTGGHQGIEAVSPVGPARLPIGSSFLSKSTSPASHSLSTLNSPRTGEHHSPISASPRSLMFDQSSSNILRDPRVPPDHAYPYAPLAYALPPAQPASTMTPSHPLAALHQNPVDLPSRRSVREITRLPQLTHEDTTWSSGSSHSGSGYNLTPSLFPGAVIPMDPTKTMRLLPQPVPSIGPSPSPLDRPMPLAPLASLAGQPDYRMQGSLAALVRAGELASQVADEAMDMERSP